eukprot:TRINITY_DN1786_c0_g1_i4.p1 TRINITY_DN1786_c0_g1~~TRINITY_DN1786_c0_g1_i4.p1  ORF type:complete len:196 (+),score=30.89 TRINITY_DN1786_c0_g1_i4:115-702(+)
MRKLTVTLVLLLCAFALKAQGPPLPRSSCSETLKNLTIAWNELNGLPASVTQETSENLLTTSRHFHKSITRLRPNCFRRVRRNSESLEQELMINQCFTNIKDMIEQSVEMNERSFLMMKFGFGKENLNKTMTSMQNSFKSLVGTCGRALISMNTEPKSEECSLLIAKSATILENYNEYEGQLVESTVLLLSLIHI